MKVFNLTDVATPGLRQRRMFNHTFALGGVSVAPGESAEVPDTAHRQVQEMVLAGMLSVDTLPPWYTAAKDAPVAAPSAVPPAPVALSARPKKKKG